MSSSLFQNCLLVLVVTSFILSCSIKLNNHRIYISEEKFRGQYIPGVIKTGRNSYLDATEITVANWQEYLFWQREAYGDDSEEFKMASIDTSFSFEYHNEDLRDIYFKHPEYWDYPLIGFSHQQALEYSKWRSNVVFLKMLLNSGILENTNQNSGPFPFTIDSFYLNDKYKEYHHLPYPHYYLPSADDYKKNLAFSDSFNRKTIKSCTQRNLFYKFSTELIYCVEYIDKKQLVTKTNYYMSDSMHFLWPVGCFNCRKPVLFHLKGNVAEFTSDSLVVTGGHWLTKTESFKTMDFLPNTAPNHFTGFRNAFKWKYYSKD